MSYNTFFDFTVGLAKTIRVPKGTFQRMMDHVCEVTEDLGLETEVYNGETRWKRHEVADNIKDDEACQVVMDHNEQVRWFYSRLAEWQSKPLPRAGSEGLTPAKAKKFWFGLHQLDMPIERWSNDYYRAEMEMLYEVMRGRETDGVSFNAKTPLTPEQCDAVMTLFSSYLDTHDIRLAVCEGEDSLRSSYHGEYSWCSQCGAIAEDDVESKVRTCHKRKDDGCDLRDEYGDQYEDELEDDE